ncbi:MAG: transporter substrate-binding domain-containing protein, partial [Cyanobacteria bacterium J06642_11]
LDLETEWITYQSVSDLLAGVQTGEIDVAIAGISVTAQREAQGLDFSYPFYQSGLQLLVKRPTSTAATAASAVLQWHHLRPILLIFGSSTVVGGLIWLVERKHNEGFSGDVVQGVSQGIWFAIVTLGTFGYGDVTPTKFAGRLIATLWMGLSFFIVADFIASLTVQQLSESDVSLESLWGKPVGAISGTTGAIFLQSQPVKLMVYPDFDTAIAALESGTVAGVVQDAPTLKHFVNLHPNRFELVGDLLTNEGYGIAVRENNMDLLEAVDQKILKYQQLGFLQQLHQKWFQAGTPAEIEP